MDPIVTKALAAMNDENKAPWLPQTTKEDWKFDHGHLCFKNQMYILDELQYQLVMSILHLLQKEYWWLGISTFLQKCISDCALCQSAKVNTHSMVPGLTPFTVKSPIQFSSISVNLISGLPLSNGFDSVMVVVDHELTKGAIFCSCTKEIDVAGVALLFFCHVFPWFRLHSKVISNKGPQFASTFSQKLTCLLQYNVTLSTAYHLQTGRKTEQVNQELETYLWLFSLNKPEEWSSLLPMVEFSHNAAIYSVTQHTSFTLMLRYEPHAYPPLGKTLPSNLEKRLLYLSAAFDNAQAAHKIAQQKMKEWITTKVSPWKVGDKVWLETTNLHMGGPKKLQMKRTGPFEVKEVISCTAFCLCIPP